MLALPLATRKPAREQVRRPDLANTQEHSTQGGDSFSSRRPREVKDALVVSGKDGGQCQPWDSAS